MITSPGSGGAPTRDYQPRRPGMTDVPAEEQWMGRMRGLWERPPGLAYFPDFVTAPEEERLLCRLAEDSYGEVRMRGQVARRTGGSPSLW